jgi:hypothetical protein
MAAWNTGYFLDFVKYLFYRIVSQVQEKMNRLWFLARVNLAVAHSTSFMAL